MFNVLFCLHSKYVLYLWLYGCTFCTISTIFVTRKRTEIMNKVKNRLPKLEQVNQSSSRRVTMVTEGRDETPPCCTQSVVATCPQQ